MRKTILPALVAAGALTFAGSAYAQRGHAAQPHAPEAMTQVHGSAATTHGAQAHGTASVHGAQAHGTKTKAPAPSTHGSSAHAATSAATTNAAAKNTTGTAPATSAALTPVQQKLQKSTRLAARLQSDLPRGMTVQRASLGFRNLGQFVAAVNVSQNLGIPFADLKRKMTGENALSLGQAIHVLKPDADAKRESRAAERQAEAMVAAHS